MIDEYAFKRVYNESRNGVNQFIAHPLIRSFHMSDGIKDLADTGCWWLMDILATECPQQMARAAEQHCLVEVVVEGCKAHIALTYDDVQPCIWARRITWTDLPEGRWVFELVDEGERRALCLLSEH